MSKDRTKRKLKTSTYEKREKSEMLKQVINNGEEMRRILSDIYGFFENEVFISA